MVQGLLPTRVPPFHRSMQSGQVGCMLKSALLLSLGYSQKGFFSCNAHRHQVDLTILAEVTSSNQGEYISNNALHKKAQQATARGALQRDRASPVPFKKTSSSDNICGKEEVPYVLHVLSFTVK